MLLWVGIGAYLGILRIFQPLFTDEITYFMMANRYLVEGSDLWRFMPDCLPGPLTVGWILYPFYVVRSLVAGVGHSPFFLVVLSYLQALLFVWVCSRLSAVGAAEESPWDRLIRLAPLGLGAFPAYLLLGRPEMFALLLIGVQLLLVAKDKPLPLPYEIGPVVAVVLAGALCSHHPQMVVFIPFFLVSAWWRRSPVVSILCMVGICLLGVQTLQLGASMRSCADRPVIHQLLAQVTLQTAGAWEHPLETLVVFWRNVGNSVVLLNALALNELTSVAFPYVYRFPYDWIGTIFRVPVVLFAILLLVAVLQRVLDVLSTLFSESRIRRRDLCLLTLLACMVLWAGMRGPKMWYLVVLLYGVGVLLWIQMCPRSRGDHRMGAPWWRMLEGLGLGLAGVSCVLNLVCLVGADHSPIRGSSVATAVFPLEVSSLTNEINELVQICGLPSDRSNLTLVTDDFSSLALWDVAHQLHATYYTVWAPDLKDPVAYVKRMGAWGFVGRCSGYESLYGASRFRLGSLCCQPYEVLKSS